MLALYHRWEALGPDPLPAAISLLDRLRRELDAVSVFDTELNRRYLAGARRRPGAPVPPEETAFRRRLFTALKNHRRTVHDVLDETTDLHESETAALLADTHAIAIVAAVSGLRRTASAFRDHHLALGTAWKAAHAQLPPVLTTLSSTAAPGHGTSTVAARVTRMDAALARAAREADAQRLAG
ncbi:hypothetical protein [Streptomyces niveus]|uniref:hypothetical protein n=1 Tax=Streptomyces niveus TaxID=193462 RepID=UPI00342CE037